MTGNINIVELKLEFVLFKYVIIFNFRTNRLLDNVCAGVGAPIFFSHLWECLANNLAVRLPAILYILSRFDRKLLIENQSHIMGTNIDTMVTAICACVQDTMVLVQRSGLDLLQVGFPMHNTQLSKSDMIRLVTASLITILRRDMSLNRYFKTHVKHSRTYL